MSPSRIETLTWVLIFGGLLALSLGLFVLRRDAGIGGTIVVAGALAAAVGVVLIWVRSRMKTSR
jgi:hypothetical protein